MDTIEITEYGDKKFLAPNSNDSCSMYHAKVVPTENRWKFTIHDCNNGIRFLGKLEKEEDFDFAIERLNNLKIGIEKFIDYFINERKKLFDNIFAIGNHNNTVHLCNLYEEDYCKFYNENKIVNLCTDRDCKIETKGHYSDTFISDNKFLEEILSKQIK